MCRLLSSIHAWLGVMRILIPQILEYLREKNADLEQRLSTAAESQNYQCLLDIVSSDEYQRNEVAFIELHCDSVNFKFWWQYMSMVSILLQFIRGMREGSWDMYLKAFGSMLPFFHRYDHINYARWGAIYLSEMKQLPREVEQEFRQGNFVVKGSDNCFNQVDADHSLEWLNGIGKKAGGIVGITKTTSALSRWALSYNLRACVAAQTRKMFHVSVDDEITQNESAPSRMKRDNHDENGRYDVLQRFRALQPGHGTEKLVNIATKDVATADIQASLLNANEKGHLLLEEFVTKRLIDKTSKLTNTLKKVNAPTFASLFEVKKDVKKEKTEVYKADRARFQRLITAYQAGRSVDLDAILKHELMKVPISISETNSDLRTGNKALLVYVLTKDVVCAPEVNLKPTEGQSCLVVDGQAAVVALGRPSEAKTFGDYASRFVDHILSLGRRFDRIDVTFDQYTENGTSVKDETRSQRKKGSRPVRRLIEDKDVPLPIKWSNFLALSENKKDLSAFLSEELAQSTPPGKTIIVAGALGLQVISRDSQMDVEDLEASHEEADTQRILHCIHSTASHHTKRIVVAARDTDIALLLLAHFNKMKCDELWLKAGTAKKPKYIPLHDIWRKLGFEQTQFDAMLSFHAITGCDMVSYFMGHSKKTEWDVFTRHHQLQEELGQSTLLSEAGLQKAETFICGIYGVPSNSCDEGRVLLFSKCKAHELLPPTSDAAKFHILRAHHQSYIWRHANEFRPVLPPLTENGWDSRDGKLYPILTTLSPVPKACQEIVFCGCKKGCSSNNCSCRKGGNPCTAACKCSDRTVPCRNRK